MADRSRYVSKPQLAGYLRQAGFSEEMIPTMIGISTAESSLDTKAFNPNVNTGDQSYGLFQINMLGGMGPERREQFGIRSNEELFDPLTNAKAAKAIYDQQGLGAWSVYKSGAYEKYVPQMDQIPSTPGVGAPMVPDDAVIKTGGYKEYDPQTLDQIPYTPGNPPPMVPDDAVIYDQTYTDPSRQTRKTVNEILSKLGYDTDQYEKVDKKATSLKDSFVEQLKGQFLSQLLRNPLGGLF